MTMAFRPVGGFIFGLLADRYGRRIPLMINTGVFAISDILTGLAPNYTVLLIVRALFGIVMGGCWGVGASLAMEGAPARKRGILSGLLQEGYAAGNVLAAVAYFFLIGPLGWRPLFYLGSVPAICLVLYIKFRVKESAVWQNEFKSRQPWPEQRREILSHWKLFLYLLLFMTMMLFASHGTQDMYPTFLQRQWHFSPAQPGHHHRHLRHRRHHWRHRLRTPIGQMGPPQSHRPGIRTRRRCSFPYGPTRPIRRCSSPVRS